jgi:hypothetical protein
VGLSPVGSALTVWPTLPAPNDDDDCGAIGGMKIGRGNRSIWRKAAAVPICSPQISHDPTRALTWAVALGNQRQTA